MTISQRLADITLEAAEKTGVPSGTAEKWIRAFCAEGGTLEKVAHGRYRKR